MHRIPAWHPASSPPPLDPGTLHLWWLAFDSEAPAPAANLSEEEQAQASRLRHGGRFACFRSGLRRILGAYLQLSPDRVPFAYGPRGKPRVDAPHRPRVDFNMAHSGDCALVAVTSGTELGVDLERERRIRHALGIARRQFGNEAAAALQALPEDEFTRGFLARWTAWEACIKSEGEGIFSGPRHPCDAVVFAPHEGWVAALACRGPLPPPSHWHGLVLQPAPDEETAPGRT